MPRNGGDDGNFSLKLNALTVNALVFLIGTGVEDLVLPYFGSVFSTYAIQ